MIMFGGGIASLLRIQHCERICNQIESFKDKPENELEQIILNYKSKNILYRIFNDYSDSLADYESTKAVKNMRYLGLTDFPLKKQSVFGVYGALYDLEKSVKQKKTFLEKLDNLGESYRKEFLSK